MKRFPLAGLALVAVLIWAVGCFDLKNPNDSDDSPPEIPELIIFKAPNSSAVPAALKNSIDQFNANMATGYTYLSIATINKPNKKDNRYVWEVKAGGFTAIIEAVPAENDQVNWSVVISGSDGNVTFNNWKAMEGTSNRSGKKGEWHIFKENSTEELGVYNWEVREDDSKFGSFTMSTEAIRYEVVNNPDGSGSFVKYENGIKVFEATWNASGAGSWTEWDTQGNVVNSGSWN
jgi:hypothetical protein